MKKIEELKKQYNSIEIPKGYDEMVWLSIEQGKKETNLEDKVESREYKMKSRVKKGLIASAAAVATLTIGFTGAVNLSPAFANTMADLPVLGGLVRVVSFNQFEFNKDTYNADLEAPIIDGLSDTELQKSLNSKYLEENKQLYDQFKKDVADMEAVTEGGHLGVDSGYEVKTDNEEILSIGRWVVNTVGSSSTVMQYDTIDKVNQVLITLPSLFKDDSYIDIVSENIVNQMKAQMEADENNIYWIKGMEGAMGDEGFEKITKDQQFYINQAGKLVISFDKYQVAPGYMGVVEFEIPTEAIQDILVGNGYIK